MKIVINCCCGGFSLSDEAEEILGKDRWDIERTDANLIALIEEKGADFVGGKYSNLVIVEIPNEATDWEIIDYNGLEYIIAVIDGKIKHFH